jgi:hypothetical protein
MIATTTSNSISVKPRALDGDWPRTFEIGSGFFFIGLWGT